MLNLETNKLEYYSHETTPKKDVAKAMNESCLLPLAFSQKNGKADGGIGNNFACDKALLVNTKRREKNPKKQEGIVLGINLDNNKDYYVPESFSVAKRIVRDIFSLFFTGYHRRVYREEREDVMATGIAEGRLMIVNAPYANVSSSNFKLNEHEKTTLKSNGTDSAKRFLEKKVRVREDETVIASLYADLLDNNQQFDKNSFELIKYKEPYYQQSFMAQVNIELKKIESEKRNSAEDTDMPIPQLNNEIDRAQIKYLEKVKISPIYEVIKGNSRQWQGGFFKDKSPKQIFDEKLHTLSARVQHRAHLADEHGRSLSA
ncbi:MAG: hypothetical protein K2Q14_01585 [Gammaproteobacteria bacterium]|nr:hypothetical protein [Gammaproteobacteria bacterium]